MIKRGQTVYVANAKTKKVDIWFYNQTITVGDTRLVELYRNRKKCTIPENCVFFTKEDALQALAL